MRIVGAYNSIVGTYNLYVSTYNSHVGTYNSCRCLHAKEAVGETIEAGDGPMEAGYDAVRSDESMMPHLGAYEL